MVRFLIAMVFGALAQVPASDPAPIAAYQSAIRQGRVEDAFTALVRVEDALTKGQDAGLSILETMSEDAFQRLQRDLPGAVVNREEILFIKPGLDYFIKFAAAKGSNADRRFFATYKNTYPDGLWPSYINQQTDHGGCTRFGSGKLVDTYRAWTEFQRAFPNRYSEAARKEVQDVGEVILSSTCVCNDAATVQQELRSFLQQFPGAPIRPKVEERLKALQTGNSRLRIHCISD